MGRRSATLLPVVWAMVVALITGGCTEILLDPVPPDAERVEALRPLLPDVGNLPYIVLGDWGRQGRGFQDDVANQMGVVAQILQSRFVVTTGDNFYDHGVKSITDGHWRASFEGVYTHPALMIPWYITLGNHDYEGNVQAQIDYTTHSSRWTLPSTYHSILHEIDAETSVQFVFIDTQPLREHSQAAPRQLRWIDSTLTVTKTAWTIVVGHHPIYSGGYHGDDEVLIKELKPILEKHWVDAYFSGHDHDLQHLYDGSTHYFVSGAGSKLRETGRHRFTQFGITRPGFMAVSMRPTQMVVHLVDHEGNMLYGALVDRSEETLSATK